MAVGLHPLVKEISLAEGRCLLFFSHSSSNIMRVGDNSKQCALTAAPRLTPVGVWPRETDAFYFVYRYWHAVNTTFVVGN